MVNEYLLEFVIPGLPSGKRLHGTLEQRLYDGLHSQVPGFVEVLCCKLTEPGDATKSPNLIIGYCRVTTNMSEKQLGSLNVQLDRHTFAYVGDYYKLEALRCVPSSPRS